jgi:hypothetical protein
MSAIAGAGETHFGPWNPGIQSQVPGELRQLCTIFRPENGSRSLAACDELRALTGMAASDLVVFRPRRLLLHELLIRVTADFVVPDGSRIEDLGINFREITRLLLSRYLEPQLDAITAEYDQAAQQLGNAIHAALDAMLTGPSLQDVPPPAPRAARALARLAGRYRRAPPPLAAHSWGIREITACERQAAAAPAPMQRAAYRALAQTLAALYNSHGQAWGTRELIGSLATGLAANDYGSEVIGLTVDPLLKHAAQREGYGLLPRQVQPVVMNTKGPSAAGKSTLRPLQKRLAGEIGVRWSDFALISPDIWRKQLLDYGSLGATYKYAGAFTSEELQVVDQKLDRYMARKHARGETSHLLIDRFRFDSFAADSDEAGSNLLTRFGQSVYLFFLITPPELLVERAWKRGLEFGRYKAVDDTLAHGVEAYAGMPAVFFTWAGHTDKRVQFEFLDNSVAFGERPRTVAFGANDSLCILDVAGLLNIERYRRVDVDARAPDTLYPDRALLAPEHNAGFLRRCIERFREVSFADQRSGRLYLRIVAGRPVLVDRDALARATDDADTWTGVRVAAPAAIADPGSLPAADGPIYLSERSGAPRVYTLGQWGAGRD